MVESTFENGVSTRRCRSMLKQIAAFDGQDKEDIESYMNYLLTERDVLYSRFLIFFLSCTNLQKFYLKREKEYKKTTGDKWLSSVVKKYVSPQPTGASSEQQKGVSGSQKSRDEGMTEFDEDSVLHVFLEEVQSSLLNNREQYAKAIDTIEELKLNYKQLTSNLKKLADIYSELSMGYYELEKSGRPEITQIVPSVSSLYSNLKKCVFQMSNTYEQHLNILKRYISRNLEDVSHHSTNLCKCIDIRSDAMRRFAYSIQKSKTGKEFQSMALAVVREERLKGLNAGLLKTIVDCYHQEQEAVMMTNVNISAHLIETHKRDSVFWEEILRITNADAIANRN